ncbi:MAG: hypothetical protein EBR30_03700 [Cytophagia bacterium]|nr:hypothetical protein [Cytophagia bacterium]NBW34117.1 hypothetical protein [Cytophagia bacterium]
MNKVQIVPNSSTGALISAYQSNPEFGYVQLLSEEIVVAPGEWAREKRRSTLLRGEVSVLTKFVNMYKSGMLPGRIVVQEFREDELPENFSARLNKNLPYEQAIQGFVKRAGKDGVELTSGGQRILRFTDYDPSGTMQDTRVAHENVSEVVAQRASVSASGAMLPG